MLTTLWRILSVYQLVFMHTSTIRRIPCPGTYGQHEKCICRRTFGATGDVGRRSAHVNQKPDTCQ